MGRVYMLWRMFSQPLRDAVVTRAKDVSVLQNVPPITIFVPCRVYK